MDQSRPDDKLIKTVKESSFLIKRELCEQQEDIWEYGKDWEVTADTK